MRNYYYIFFIICNIESACDNVISVQIKKSRQFIFFQGVAGSGDVLLFFIEKNYIGIPSSVCFNKLH